MTTRVLILLMVPFIILMNYLSQMRYFGDIWVADLASRTSWSIATPAGWAFGIRWLIYLWLFWYCIYQYRPKSQDVQIIESINIFVLVNLFINWLWYIFSTIQWYVWISAILIAIMWISAGLVVHKLAQNDFLKSRPRRIMFLFSFTWCVYFGWLTVATPLNFWWALTDLWYTWAETSAIAVFCWTAISYITSIVVYTQIKRIEYVCVIIRALIAVIYARFNNVLMWVNEFNATPILYIALWLLIGMVCFVFIPLFSKKKIY